MALNGIINIRKEKGYTSNDVVAVMRGILKQKKIGHTGTLDPDASGVLPVCIGTATKLCDLLTDKTKSYRAVVLLGKSTDTQDISGKVLRETEPVLKETCKEDENGRFMLKRQEIEEVINSFKGSYMQLPPMYSALKVGGKKLVDLARQGIEVERKKREVFFYEINILEFDFPRITMDVICSKGTYIRTLCHDIGEKLGCGACMESLVRTKVDRFLLEDAKTLKEIEELAKKGEVEKQLLSVDTYFEFYDKACIKNKYRKYLLNGNKLKPEFLDLSAVKEPYTYLRTYDINAEFIGIYQFMEADKIFKPYKLFNGAVK